MRDSDELLDAGQAKRGSKAPEDNEVSPLLYVGL